LTPEEHRELCIVAALEQETFAQVVSRLVAVEKTILEQGDNAREKTSLAREGKAKTVQ
jgi:hypothetical protein